MFNGITNVNFFSDTLSKYTICSCAGGDWVNFEYIFGYTDDYKCPYNLVASKSMTVLEINRNSFAKNVPPTIKKYFHDKAVKIIENLETRIKKIEQTSKSVMDMTLNFDYDELIKDSEDNMLKLSKNLAKKELMEYLKNPDNSNFRKYIRDLREMVYSVKKSAFYEDSSFISSFKSKTNRCEGLTQAFSYSESQNLDKNFYETGIDTLLIKKTPNKKSILSHKENLYASYEPDITFKKINNYTTNNLQINDSPKNTNQNHSPNRLKEHFIKSAFKKTDNKQIGQRASSTSCKPSNLRSYLHNKIGKKSNQKRPETAQAGRHVRFAGNNNVSTPNILDDSRIRNLSRDQITPLAKHSTQAEKFITHAKNKKWDTEKMTKRSERIVLSINDSLLDPTFSKDYKGLSTNTIAISKPPTDSNLGIKKYSKKLDSKSTMNSLINIVFSKKAPEKDNNEIDISKIYKLKKHDSTSASIDLKNLKKKNNLLKGHQNDVFSHFTKESRFEDMQKIHTSSGKAFNELKKLHESTVDTNLTENNEFNDSRSKH